MRITATAWMLTAVALLVHQEWSVLTSVTVSAFTTATPPLGTTKPASWSSSSSSSTCWAEKKSEYQFGDITKGVFHKFTERVKSVTGKDTYEFGDLSKWLDENAKEKVGVFTNNQKSDYAFGDISKEVMRRVTAGEYTREDLLLLIKIIAVVGINFQPMARLLPAKVLLDILNVSIYQQLGEKVTGVVSNELDQRMKQAVTGDKDYQIGDFTKRAILKFTGKDEYTFGDITNRIVGSSSSSQQKQSKDKQQQQPKPIVVDDQVEKELLEWDAAAAAAIAKEDSEGGSDGADQDESVSRLTRRQLEEWDSAFSTAKGDSKSITSQG
jgi:hypothetical protein